MRPPPRAASVPGSGEFGAGIGWPDWGPAAGSAAHLTARRPQALPERRLPVLADQPQLHPVVGARTERGPGGHADAIETHLARRRLEPSEGEKEWTREITGHETPPSKPRWGSGPGVAGLQPAPPGGALRPLAPRSPDLSPQAKKAEPWLGSRVPTVISVGEEGWKGKPIRIWAGNVLEGVYSRPSRQTVWLGKPLHLNTLTDACTHTRTDTHTHSGLPSWFTFAIGGAYSCKGA